MKNVLLKAMLPVAAFVLASAGAVSTSKSDTSASVSFQGWKQVSPVECELVRECNNIGTILCTSGGDQMFAKLTPASYCDEVLTHRP